MQAVLSVLLATFTGFGVTMCGNSILVGALRWRTTWSAQSNQQRSSQEVIQLDQPLEIPNEGQMNPSQNENERANIEAIRAS